MISSFPFLYLTMYIPPLTIGIMVAGLQLSGETCLSDGVERKDGQKGPGLIFFSFSFSFSFFFFGREGIPPTLAVASLSYGTKCK